MNDGEVVRAGVEKQAKTRPGEFLQQSETVFAYLGFWPTS